jgi:hypothetical protein
MRKGFRLFLILGFTLGAALSAWVWEVRGQNAQRTTAAPPSNQKWECKKFDFLISGEPGGTKIPDLEAFLQTAGQVQLVSSGLAENQVHLDHYDVIACRQP